MQRTLIAVFDNRGDAQSAIEELVLSGFSRQQIRLSEGDPTGAPSDQAGSATAGAGGLVDSIKNFLGSIFGTDNSEHVQKYSDAVTRGHHVLTLTVADEAEVERAADIVERYGPVDIDEKVAGWSGGPLSGALAGETMRTGGAAQQQSASMSQQSMQGGAASVQGGGQAGSQQRAASLDDDRALPVSGRPGVKVYEHLAEPPLGTGADLEDADESYFRSHYNSNFAGSGEHFEDYASAYQFGRNMASDEQYHGRPWKDVEPALRSDWEGRNPGSAWSKFKAAVHHGWQRLTS